jgi:hypothetical protein
VAKEKASCTAERMGPRVHVGVVLAVVAGSGVACGAPQARPSLLPPEYEDPVAVETPPAPSTAPATPPADAGRPPDAR